MLKINICFEFVLFLWIHSGNFLIYPRICNEILPYSVRARIQLRALIRVRQPRSRQSNRYSTPPTVCLRFVRHSNSIHRPIFECSRNRRDRLHRVAQIADTFSDGIRRRRARFSVAHLPCTGWKSCTARCHSASDWKESLSYPVKLFSLLIIPPSRNVSLILTVSFMITRI